MSLFEKSPQASINNGFETELSWKSGFKRLMAKTEVNVLVKLLSKIK